MPVDHYAKARAKDIGRREAMRSEETDPLTQQANRILSDSKKPRKKKREPAKMPFGKHKGMTIRDIPLDYLLWLKRNCKLDYKLKTRVQSAIDAKQLKLPLRCKKRAPKQAELPPSSDADTTLPWEDAA